MDNKASSSGASKKTFENKSDNASSSSSKVDTKLYRRQNKNKGEVRSNQHVVLLLQDSSCSTAENVFQIDHILESMVLRLDRATLLNCRLLSSRWAYFCSKALQKKVTIVFYVRQINNPPIKAENLVVVKALHGRSVKDLITVMDNSASFPSTSLKFFNTVQYYNLDNLFNLHGHSVKKYESDGIVTVEEMRQLLLTQAPNLEALLIKRVVIQIPVHFPETYYDMKLREAWTQPYLYDAFTTRRIPILKNLQVFQCNDQLPEIFVQQLLHCSPNLVEVILPEVYLHNLVVPVDRVHLLKELTLGFRFYDYHPLDYILNYHPDRLALRKISFSGSFYYLEFPTNAYLASFDFMRKLLQASAATCKKLKWHGVVKHFEIPQMPQVTHIVLQINMINGRPVSVFENGVILGNTFPNLKILEVQSEQYIAPLVPIGYFFGIYNNEPAPVTSVRNVNMKAFSGSQDYIRDIGRMFPNAFIYGWYITMLPARNQIHV